MSTTEAKQPGGDLSLFDAVEDETGRTRLVPRIDRLIELGGLRRFLSQGSVLPPPPANYPIRPIVPLKLPFAPTVPPAPADEITDNRRVQLLDDLREMAAAYRVLTREGKAPTATITGKVLDRVRKDMDRLVLAVGFAARAGDWHASLTLLALVRLAKIRRHADICYGNAERGIISILAPKIRAGQRARDTAGAWVFGSALPSLFLRHFGAKPTLTRPTKSGEPGAAPSASAYLDFAEKVACCFRIVKLRGGAPQPYARETIADFLYSPKRKPRRKEKRKP